MTGRPPLPVGSHGTIKVVELGPKSWVARCRYRDADGETRRVERTGASKNAATNALKAALAERRHAAGAVLTPDSRVRDAAVLWLEQRQAEVDAGDLSVTTLEVYRSAWRLYVEPALGGLRLREVSVARAESWKVALRKSRGPSATKSARTVLSGLLGHAARLGAIQTNPVRDLSRIPGGTRRRVRAMTREERLGWLASMEDRAPLLEQLRAAEGTGDAAVIDAARRRLQVAEKATRWDIPDLTRFMLATGCRIGEALAVSWEEVHLDAGTVEVQWRLVPVKGEGLRRVAGAKSVAGTRQLHVPSWCRDMLLRRKINRPRLTLPVFPDSVGGWRDPHNVGNVFREVRDAAGFDWVTSHVFRKTALTALDEGKLSAREIADVAGHADPSMTMRVYMGRGIASTAAADALEDLL